MSRPEQSGTPIKLPFASPPLQFPLRARAASVPSRKGPSPKRNSSAPPRVGGAPRLPSIQLPANHSTPVGGRLARHWKQWFKITSNWWIRSTVKRGLRVPLSSLPSQQRLPPEVPQSVDRATVDKEVATFLQAAVLEPAAPSSNPLRFYHSHFTVPKRGTNTFRHVINMRKGNNHVTPIHFRMEGLRNLKEVAKKGDWGVKLDIASAFSHVPIATDNRDFFRIRWKGRHMRFRGMPFGYKDAPRVFTMLMRAALRPLRSAGIRMIVYLDDIFILGESPSVAARHANRVAQALHDLGFDLKHEKCSPHPAQVVEFLGFHVDLRFMTLLLPAHKRRALRHEIQQLRRSQLPVPATALARLVGKLQACHPALPSSNLFLRSLHRDLSRTVQDGGWSGVLRNLSQESSDDLFMWLSHLKSWEGVQIIPQSPQIILTTDASEWAWGGWLSLPESPDTVIASTWQYFPRAERQRPSNWREMTATLRSMQSFSSLLAGKRVKVRTDNIANMANILKGGGPSPALTERAKAIWEVAQSLRLSLSAEFLPGVKNTVADSLSRSHEPNDWKLHPALFKALDSLWGPLDVDLFASSANRQVENFFSYRPDPLALAVDAFAQDWGAWRGYANPPWPVIGRTLAQVRRATRRQW